MRPCFAGVVRWQAGVRLARCSLAVSFALCQPLMTHLVTSSTEYFFIVEPESLCINLFTVNLSLFFATKLWRCLEDLQLTNRIKRIAKSFLCWWNFSKNIQTSNQQRMLIGRSTRFSLRAKIDVKLLIIKPWVRSSPNMGDEKRLPRRKNAHCSSITQWECGFTGKADIYLVSAYPLPYAEGKVAYTRG